MPTKPQKPQGKRTAEQDQQGADPREQTGAEHGGVKPPAEHDNRGKHYGQREGSTVTEDNDVE